MPETCVSCHTYHTCTVEFKLQFCSSLMKISWHFDEKRKRIVRLHSDQRTLDFALHREHGTRASFPAIACFMLLVGRTTMRVFCGRTTLASEHCSDGGRECTAAQSGRRRERHGAAWTRHHYAQVRDPRHRGPRSRLQHLMAEGRWRTLWAPVRGHTQQNNVRNG